MLQFDPQRFLDEMRETLGFDFVSFAPVTQAVQTLPYRVLIKEPVRPSYLVDTVYYKEISHKILEAQEEERLISLTVRGYTNKEIAQALRISVKTVASQKQRSCSSWTYPSLPLLFRRSNT